MDEESFLAALDARPGDETTRLVYADWLDDHGQADRAAFLRAEAELALMPEDERESAPQSEVACRGWDTLDRAWAQRVAQRWELALTAVDFTPTRDEDRVFWKIQVIMGVRKGAEAIGRWLGLMQAKKLVEACPGVLLAGLSWAAARAAKARIQAPRDDWGYVASRYPGLPWRCAGTLVIRPMADRGPGPPPA
jgi:uncharacterized protein (TIGR02996 family)